MKIFMSAWLVVCLYQLKRLPIHLWIDLKGDLEGYRLITGTAMAGL